MIQCMDFVRRQLCLLACSVCLGSLAAYAKELVDPVKIIDLARAHYGPSKLLDSVQTIYYEGELLDPKGEEIPGEFRMFLQKPMSQRIEVQIGDVVDIRCTNGLEGYHMRYNKRSGQKRITVVDSGQLETMIVGALENLNFLRVTEHRRRNVWFRERVEYQGSLCYKLRFVYNDGLYYERFIDVENGRILLTQDSNGLQIHQRGEVYANGIRFPKTLESYKDQKHLNTLKIDLALLNRKIPETFFDFPDS